MNAISRTSGPLARLGAVLGTDWTLRAAALASVIANIAIVVTGGAVRLTSSGLGCPTWPHCAGSSFVETPELGIHGIIENWNRRLTFVVGLLALLCVIAAWLNRRQSRQATTGGPDTRPGTPRGRFWWAVAVLASIPAQAVLGGISVLTKLNPWVVSCHFLLSSVVIAVAYQLWIRTKPATPAEPAAKPLRALAVAIVAVTAAVLAAGTVVTGSGPHAGDAKAHRTGLDPAAVAQLHTDLVMLLIGLSVAAWLMLRATGARRGAQAAAILVLVECAQSLIGFVQYFTHLPVILVGAHMLGACLVLVAALALLAEAVPPARPLARWSAAAAPVIRTPEPV